MTVIGHIHRWGPDPRTGDIISEVIEVHNDGRKTKRIRKRILVEAKDQEAIQDDPS
jgi:hypothetical protein